LGDVDEFLHLSARIKIDQQHPVFEDGATDSFSASGCSRIQQQESLLIPRAELITAAAHPTPTSTLMAAVGQFIWQAPHSMQASLQMTSAFPDSTANTPWGQTSVHIPHPMHLSGSSFKVTTFFKYINFFIYLL
jgi:hypothetical protein